MAYLAKYFGRGTQSQSRCSGKRRKRFARIARKFYPPILTVEELRKRLQEERLA